MLRCFFYNGIQIFSCGQMPSHHVGLLGGHVRCVVAYPMDKQWARLVIPWLYNSQGISEAVEDCTVLTPLGIIWLSFSPEPKNQPVQWTVNPGRRTSAYWLLCLLHGNWYVNLLFTHCVVVDVVPSTHFQIPSCSESVRPIQKCILPPNVFRKCCIQEKQYV